MKLTLEHSWARPKVLWAASVSLLLALVLGTLIGAQWGQRANLENFSAQIFSGSALAQYGPRSQCCATSSRQGIQKTMTRKRLPEIHALTGAGPLAKAVRGFPNRRRSSRRRTRKRLLSRQREQISSMVEQVAIADVASGRDGCSVVGPHILVFWHCAVFRIAKLCDRHACSLLPLRTPSYRARHLGLVPDFSPAASSRRLSRTTIALAARWRRRMRGSSPCRIRRPLIVFSDGFCLSIFHLVFCCIISISICLCMCVHR